MFYCKVILWSIFCPGQGREPGIFWFSLIFYQLLCHGDRKIQIEIACLLYDVKMTWHGLLHKGFNISSLSLMGMYRPIVCHYKNNLTWGDGIAQR